MKHSCPDSTHSGIQDNIVVVDHILLELVEQIADHIVVDCSWVVVDCSWVVDCSRVVGNDLVEGVVVWFNGNVG